MNVMQEVTNNYAEAIQAIKQAILKSRYNAAALVNREMLTLYFGVAVHMPKISRNRLRGSHLSDYGINKNCCEKLSPDK